MARVISQNQGHPVNSGHAVLRKRDGALLAAMATPRNYRDIYRRLAEEAEGRLG